MYRESTASPQRKTGHLSYCHGMKTQETYKRACQTKRYLLSTNSLPSEYFGVIYLVCHLSSGRCDFVYEQQIPKQYFDGHIHKHCSSPMRGGTNFEPLAYQRRHGMTSFCGTTGNAYGSYLQRKHSLSFRACNTYNQWGKLLLRLRQRSTSFRLFNIRRVGAEEHLRWGMESNTSQYR
jgi:hypothetical protein